MPPAQCSEYGCKQPTIKHSALCEAHAPKTVVSDDRKNFNRTYNTASWRSIRSRQISIAPLCQACFSIGKINSAEHVDHVFPWKKIGNFAFTRNIFQSLCGACHSTKTSLEQKGIFRYYSADEVKDLTVHDYKTYC